MSFTDIAWGTKPMKSVTLGTFLELIEPGTPVVSRDGKLRGKTNRKHFRCRMDGCFGWRIAVKWPGGKWTYPCSKGMEYDEGQWRII